ncbi:MULTISPECIES: LLM class flavin-dependent oxidoreductase [Mesorhizobium]|uniref:LLM class flavin-dependent oxidoreductase n=1 Tax=Mesorhizobium denitrificans TaxID=2294114 RepID=A0A371XBL3_9HYPH|nr:MULTISPECIES: LLM class flavin-dependent oxidoreductase [Mesorhizobium]RFC66610.1 LLM class flavin-dependent oxidoreductase [Mesorhizobium denitrificans]
MEIGIYSFGDVQKDATTGELGSTAEATRNLLEAIQLADQVGLDYFGIGEHHTREMPASAATVILGAAAASTKNIKLGSAVTVLSTDDPVRVYQQFATLDALSNGRAEITAGRGSSTESFPLFGHSLNDYDALYAEKLDLLMLINESESVTWNGKFRPALNKAQVVPRPDGGSLPIWLATGGNPQSSVRAGLNGLPISYAIIGGQANRFAPLAELYRRAAAQAGVAPEKIKVSVASPGFVGEDAAKAKDFFWTHWHAVMEQLGKIRGFAPPPRFHYDKEASGDGALFAGSPEEIAERIVKLHGSLGHMRQFFQIDVGQMPHREYLRSIELFGTKVKPLVDAALGDKAKAKEANRDA